LYVTKRASTSDNKASKHDGAGSSAINGASRVSAIRRSEIAKNAALARWNPSDELASIPKEEFPGVLPIKDYAIDCAVLSNRQRVLSERSVTRALGGKRGGSHWQRAKEFMDGEYRPVFLSAHNLTPFIPPSLSIALSKPVMYRTKGGHTGYGIPAELLPEICEVLLAARRQHALTEAQTRIADAAEVLMSALAKVGIIALVDEATGYQEFRERDELMRLLDLCVAKELLPWTKRFPTEFYKELFRLRGWAWIEGSNRRPRRVGGDTEDIIYDRLPQGVKEELQRRNPVISPGYRRYRNFQFLSEDIGDPHLQKQITVATALMRASRSWKQFKHLLDRATPRGDGQQVLDMDVDNEMDDA
jgi:hypothetical protein